MMAHYYFDTHDGIFVRDEIGIECESFGDVQVQALAGLAGLAKDIVPGGKLREIAVQVRDEQDRPVMQAALRLEIELTQSRTPGA